MKTTLTATGDSRGGANIAAHGRPRNGELVGPACLLGANVGLYLALTWLTSAAPAPYNRTMLLALGNAVAAMPLLVPTFSGRPVVPSGSGIFPILGWSVCYCAAYGMLVVHPEVVSVPLLIMAQAGAPFLGMLLAGDHRRDATTSKLRIASVAPLACVGAIAVRHWGSGPGAGVGQLVAFAGLLVLFTISQACARLVARSSRVPFWLPPRLGVLNSLGLLGVACLVPSNGDWIGASRFSAIPLGLGIVAIQAALIYGLSNTPAFVSGLLLSTAVPIAILGDGYLGRGSHGAFDLLAAAAFCVSAAAVTWAMSSQRQRGPERQAPTEHAQL